MGIDVPVSERLHFVAGGSASRTARRAVREQIAAKGWSGDTDAAVLLTGELVANAILHAGSITELRVTIDDGRLKVEADDRSDALPRVRSPGLSGTTGRGLLLVDRLSLRWGTDQLLGGGKTVWFEMSELPARARARWRTAGGAWSRLEPRSGTLLPGQAEVPRSTRLRGYGRPAPTRPSK